MRETNTISTVAPAKQQQNGLKIREQNVKRKHMIIAIKRSYNFSAIAAAAAGSGGALISIKTNPGLIDLESIFHYRHIQTHQRELLCGPYGQREEL